VDERGGCASKRFTKAEEGSRGNSRKKKEKGEKHNRKIRKVDSGRLLNKRKERSKSVKGRIVDIRGKGGACLVGGLKMCAKAPIAPLSKGGKRGSTAGPAKPKNRSTENKGPSL